MNFHQGPWGGGNQFLKSLRNFFKQQGLYVEDPKKADIILFNSHHKFNEVLKLKRKYANKLFIHRIDGPISLFRKSNPAIDLAIYSINYLADGTVFQSNWSRNENYKLGLAQKQFVTTILNAPDPKIFSRNGKIPFARDRKIKLINTSWSPHWYKGFKVNQWLDNNLDFSRYGMTFIGRSPIEFKNIKWIKPITTQGVANQLKHHDIFVTASNNEACSNALVEAFHCGLPAIGINGGGNSEIIKKGGELFKRPEEIPDLIEKVVRNYEEYQDAISLPNMDEVGEMYLNFMKGLSDKQKRGFYKAKKLSKIEYIRIIANVYKWRLSSKFDQVKKLALYTRLGMVGNFSRFKMQCW